MNDARKTIRIASRGSALALAQANAVADQCRRHFPGQEVDIRIIKTTGDKLQTASLSQPQLDKGLFTKELESALLKGEADLAVHSLKDLPTELPEGLALGAVSSREDVRDVLVLRDDATRRETRDAAAIDDPFSALPQEAVVATSSTRRAAQLLNHRPDLKIIPIRGNVGTRLNKLQRQPDMNATVLAAAGLNRLQYRIDDNGTLSGPEAPPGLRAIIIPVAWMLPCVGQAALGMETRADDPEMSVVCDALTDPPTLQCVKAERAFLRAMGGGCHLAVGAHATVSGNELTLRVVSFLGDQPKRTEGRAAADQAVDLGERLARAVM